MFALSGLKINHEYNRAPLLYSPALKSDMFHGKNKSTIVTDAEVSLTVLPS